MPDKWGRPTVQDFSGLQSMYIKGSEYRKGRQAQAEAEATNVKHDAYLDKLSQGASMEDIRSEDNQFNSKAAMAATASWTLQQKRSAELTTEVKNAKMSEIMVQYEEANTLAKKAVAARQTGNDKAALEIYADLFNTKFPDGRTAKVIEKDGQWGVRIIGQDGERTSQGAEFLSIDEMTEAAETLVGAPGKGGRSNFITAYLKSERDYEDAVHKAMTFPIPMKATKDGEIIDQYRIPGKDGKFTTEYVNSKAEVIDPKEAEKMRLRPVKTYWQDLEMREAKIGAEERRGIAAPTVDKDKPLSPQGKFANDLSGSYGFDKQESMDLALELRESEIIGKQVQKMLSEGWTPDEEEIQNLLKSKAAQALIQKHLKMKQAKKGKGKKAKGIVRPPAVKKVAGRNAQVIKALGKEFPKAKEGTVKYLGRKAFIYEKGQWKVRKATGGTF